MIQGKKPIITWEGNKHWAQFLAVTLRRVLEIWEVERYLNPPPPNAVREEIRAKAHNVVEGSKDLLTDIDSEMPCPYDGVNYSEVPGWSGGEGCPVCYSQGDSHKYVEKGDGWGSRHKDHEPLKRARQIIEKSRIAWLEPDIRINRGQRFLEIYFYAGISPNFGRRSKKAEIHTFVMRSVFSLQMFEDTLVPDEFLADKIEKDVEEAGLGALLLKEAPPASFFFGRLKTTRKA